ncbi:ABC transporter ATP-binding protein [Marinitoga aeolica]|uniref:ABC transporter ATP-binding protein n=1 Tax=Marinitoga aeolica TaxID=2809031 RepID=A0ABY8PNE6_9BACT|nr:ABC transporter ATP-binding protein [Marinitoga aeolica]WGS64089.1 ABC transporter ATP-binding protein [Marinitoga aeolica]
MLKIIKYLKPYTFFLILAVLLLYIQAMTNLALPDYMSEIVNVGIQQNGVQDTIPKVVRSSQMKNLFLFMSNEDKKKVLENYEYIKKGSEKYDIYSKEYPILEKEPIYVLKDTVDTNGLNNIFAKSFFAVQAIEKGQTEGLNINKNSKLNIFKLLIFVPQQQRLDFVNNIYEKISVMGDEMIRQSLIMAIKDEYEKVGIDLYKVQRNYILKSGSIMLLITLIGAVAAILVGLLASKTAGGLARDLREKLFTKVENFAGEEFDKFSTASLITRTTNDITQIQNVMVILIRIMFYAPILSIGGIIKALDKSVSMSWTIAVAVISLLGVISVIFAFALPKFKLIQKLVDKLNLVSRENLTGMMVIRAFNTDEKEKDRFDEVNKELTKTSLFVGRLMSFLMPAMMFVLNGVMLLIIWVGAHQVNNFDIQVGDMMAFMQYAMQIIFSFLMMAMIFIFLPRASVSATRVAEVLETQPSIKDPEEPKTLNNKVKGVVEFKNVYFKYPGGEDYALKGINFKALPGQMTAIIGSTGSGKSTLVNLIPRFYDVSEGQVLIDDIDVRELTQHELREYIGYVPQKTTLFSGTIESNIKYGNENLSDEEMEKVADIAEALEFINKLPKRFKEEVSQGGVNFSGGQKQRLSIARALAKKAKIYVFDDSFSALDFKTDLNVRRKLKSYTKDSTIILVAQRISTVINADQIIVLDKGEIVGKGTHKELMNTCPVYREIAYSQLSEEELA